MNREIRLFICVLVFFLLQATVLNSFRFFGVKPDLLLISVVVFGLFLPALWVIILSCFCGMLLDLFYAGSFGVNTILFCLLGISCRKLAKNLYIDNNTMVFAVVFIASLIFTGLRRLMVPHIPAWVTLRFCVQEALYTAFVSPFVFKILSIFSY